MVKLMVVAHEDSGSNPVRPTKNYNIFNYKGDIAELAYAVGSKPASFIGSTPIIPTNNYGPIVQWQYIRLIIEKCLVRFQLGLPKLNGFLKCQKNLNMVYS